MLFPVCFKVAQPEAVGCGTVFGTGRGGPKPALFSSLPPLVLLLPRGNTLWDAAERVHAAAMSGNLNLLWRDAGMQPALVIIVRWQLVAGTFRAVERLSGSGRSKTEHCNRSRHDEP